MKRVGIGQHKHTGGSGGRVGTLSASSSALPVAVRRKRAQRASRVVRTVGGARLGVAVRTGSTHPEQAAVTHRPPRMGCDRAPNASPDVRVGTTPAPRSRPERTPGRGRC